MTTAEREQQRLDALTLANKIRMDNARLRRQLAALTPHQGSVYVASLLLEPSGPIASFPIGRLLTSVNRIGERLMCQLLREAGIFSTTKRVGALSPRQRNALAELLQERPR